MKPVPLLWTICCATLVMALIAQAEPGGREVQVKIGERTDMSVSPNLIGMNVVYSHESMDTWKDGRKLKALKDAGVSCLRYPGGHVVSFWDWEFPYHNAYQNFWDPAYIKSLTPAKRAELEKQNGSRMQLPLFFEICARAGLEPVVGINMFQGFKFNRTKDAISQAVRLVKHCMKQRPRTIYYYLDNEAGHQPEKGNHVPINDYIKLIPEYSNAIKKAQPDAKLIVNPIGWNRVPDMIKKVGAHFDVVDIHWYYNNRKWGLFYIEDWRKEQKNKKLERFLGQFRNAKKQSGNDHIKLSSLEWNLGPATGEAGSDPSSALFAGLVQADMLMSFIAADLSMAASWPLMWTSRKKNAPGSYRNFLDQDTGAPSPSKHIYRWLSLAGGGTVLDSDIEAPQGVRGLSVMGRDGKTILVYLLNKSSEGKRVSVSLPRDVSGASTSSFEKGRNVNDVRIRTVLTKVLGKIVSLEMSDTSFVVLKAEIR